MGRNEHRVFEAGTIQRMGPLAPIKLGGYPQSLASNQLILLLPLPWLTVVQVVATARELTGTAMTASLSVWLSSGLLIHIFSTLDLLSSNLDYQGT